MTGAEKSSSESIRSNRTSHVRATPVIGDITGTLSANHNRHTVSGNISGKALLRNRSRINLQEKRGATFRRVHDNPDNLLPIDLHAPCRTPLPELHTKPLQSGLEWSDESGHTIAIRYFKGKSFRAAHKIKMKIAESLGRRQHLHAIHRRIRKRVQHGINKGGQSLSLAAIGHEINRIILEERFFVLISEQLPH